MHLHPCTCNGMIFLENLNQLLSHQEVEHFSGYPAGVVGGTSSGRRLVCSQMREELPRRGAAEPTRNPARSRGGLPPYSEIPIRESVSGTPYVPDGQYQPPPQIGEPEGTFVQGGVRYTPKRRETKTYKKGIDTEKEDVSATFKVQIPGCKVVGKQLPYLQGSAPSYYGPFIEGPGAIKIFK